MKKINYFILLIALSIINITTIKAGEYRAGSTEAIVGLFNDFYASTCKPILDVNLPTDGTADEMHLDVDDA